MIRKKKIAIGLFLLFVILQFYPINREVPTVKPSLDFLSGLEIDRNMAKQIKASCYDCHSHETIYPWYAQIAPLSIWIQGHVDNGKKKLNFSEWGSYSINQKRHHLEDCIEIVEKKWMPLKSYMWLHPEGKLEETEREEMINFFKSSL